ncbi:hypothetical protein DKX38_000937 [Salix brachista]|uniref:Uncharacterized protein n=1 Tax=Salix brachista TaxID=2182728 RepID=A0A5N5P425_9ROSI|nr:hypothetical protein DKX38_000937 [Salix brachista]
MHAAPWIICCSLESTICSGIRLRYHGSIPSDRSGNISNNHAPVDWDVHCTNETHSRFVTVEGSFSSMIMALVRILR